MADELPLPRLAWDPLSQSFSKNRKRTRLSSPPVSSDPPIFSSDDGDTGAENYTQERRKKKYRGPWYRQRPADMGNESQVYELPKRSKRTFERQFDSGVFMGSDGTDIESSMEEELEPTLPEKLPLRQPRVIQVAKPMPSPEELAKGEIERCLEEGVEAIDLSSRGLTNLSNAIIRPLATFTRVPPVTQGVFFERLDPQLKIFLATNQLTSLPGELFNLERLTVLSLRANLLEELPPSISKLRKLKELNLSQNRLCYLPFEILELFSNTSRLQSLHLHPNPFYEPRFTDSVQDGGQEQQVRYKIGLGAARSRPVQGTVCIGSPEQQRRSWHAQWKVTYQARTEVRFIDINGKLLKGPNLPGISSVGGTFYRLPVADLNDSPEPPESRGNGLSRAPSLFEVALSSCARSPQLSSLMAYLPDPTPQYMYEALAQVQAKKESGASKCTICSRNFILARTEWIEWWKVYKVLETEASAASAASPLRQMENERDVSESMIPLIRRGCSWLCVPKRSMVEGNLQLLTSTSHLDI